MSTELAVIPPATAPATSLADYLIEQGHADLAGEHFACPTCPPDRQAVGLPAFALRDVRDNPGIAHSFVCGRCHVEMRRVAEGVAAAIGALFAGPDWSEVLAERRRRLSESIWATALDGTVNAEEAAAWGAYRAAVALIGPETVARPSEVSWPSRPG